jgi:hypothetical protein
MATGLFLCFALAALLAVAVVIIVVIVLLLQQPRPPQQEEERPWAPTREELPRRTAGFDVRLAEDGFWLVAPSVAYGSTVRYRCRVEGRLEHGSIPFEPGAQGQFVYTGGRPSEVEVLQVDPPSLPPERWEEPLPPVAPPPPPPRASTPPPARKPLPGFPTAY